MLNWSWDSYLAWCQTPLAAALHLCAAILVTLGLCEAGAWLLQRWRPRHGRLYSPLAARKLALRHFW
jgi:hypothetical protein